MNFDDTPAEASFRAEVRAWLDANAPKHLAEDIANSVYGSFTLQSVDVIAASKAWAKTKAASGWACLGWPTEYGGRGATPIQRVIWQQEEGIYKFLNTIFAVGYGMCGPTLMAHAREEDRRRLLPRMAAGEEIWCQLFSEPAAGSDLAGLRTKAERDGDGWVINGQKIWTSFAQYSDYGIILTRTDPTVPKHKGLTMFFLNMHSPGIEVRPIRQANGQSGFNEVFFTDVRVADTQRLGAAGNGWNVSLTTLMNERLSIGSGISTGFEWIFDFCSGFDTGDGLAVDDAAVRSRLANWAATASGLKYTGFRAISALSRGQTPGPENSIGKLVAGSMLQEIASYALELQGQAGILADPALAPDQAHAQFMMLRAPASRLEGGTDEILRNIIAERVLGLPADIRVDKDVPFSTIPAAPG
jgi:alkylation response protein AidB-like acyl-CoA dehydrogenase